MKKTALILTLALAAALPLYAGEGMSCDHSKQGEHHATAAGEQKHEEGKSCEAQEGTAVEMDGTMLCRKCDLHQTETCEKVFQTASAPEKMIPICKGSKVDLEKLGQHGGAKLHVKGKMVKCGEKGTDELYIAEATKL